MPLSPARKLALLLLERLTPERSLALARALGRTALLESAGAVSMGDMAIPGTEQAPPRRQRVSVREEEEETPHRFGCAYFVLPADLSRQVRALARSVPDSALAEDGREDDPHVTVKFGVHTDDADEVADVVEGFGPVRCRLGPISVFPAKESGGGDVVKIEVSGDDLHRLNRLISDRLECTDTHPIYKPHVTLAYVKAGTGKRFVRPHELEGKEVVFDRLTFSDRRRNKTVVSLTRNESEALTEAEEIDLGALEEADESTSDCDCDPDAADCDCHDEAALLEAGNEALRLFEAGEKRTVGDKWEGKGGRWFMLNASGRVVPTANPNKLPKAPARSRKAGTSSPDGPAAKSAKPAKRTADDVHARIAEIHATGAMTADHIEEIGGLMAGLTVPELKALKAKLGAAGKASLRKAELIDALKTKAKEVAGATTPPLRPDPGPMLPFPDVSDEHLSRVARSVLAHQKAGKGPISLHQLIQDTGLSQAAVHAAVGHLRQAGHLGGVGYEGGRHRNEQVAGAAIREPGGLISHVSGSEEGMAELERLAGGGPSPAAISAQTPASTTPTPVPAPKATTPAARSVETAVADLAALGDAAAHPDITSDDIRRAVAHATAGMSDADAVSILRGIGFVPPQKKMTRDAVERMIADRIVNRKGGFQRAGMASEGGIGREAMIGQLGKHTHAALPRAQELIAGAKDAVPAPEPRPAARRPSPPRKPAAPRVPKPAPTLPPATTAGQSVIRAVGDLYNRAATATPEDIATIKSRLDALGKNDLMHAARAAGLVAGTHRMTAQQLRDRIAEQVRARRGGTQRAGLIHGDGLFGKEAAL